MLAKLKFLERRLSHMPRPASRPELNVTTETLLKKAQVLIREVIDALSISVPILEDEETPINVVTYRDPIVTENTPHDPENWTMLLDTSKANPTERFSLSRQDLIDIITEANRIG